ncbi:MAG: mitofilin family membrane protein [Alphaproteobacteria bacterium]
MAERRATGAKSNTEGRKRKSRSAKKADEAVTREAPPSAPPPGAPPPGAPPSKKHGTLWVGLALAMVIVGAVLYGLWPVILGEREARFLGLETEAPALPPAESPSTESPSTESPSTESPPVAPDAVAPDAVESDAAAPDAVEAIAEPVPLPVESDAVEADAVEAAPVEAAPVAAVTEQENARLRVEVGALSVEVEELKQALVEATARLDQASASPQIPPWQGTMLEMDHRLAGMEARMSATAGGPEVVALSDELAEARAEIAAFAARLEVMEAAESARRRVEAHRLSMLLAVGQVRDALSRGTPFIAEQEFLCDAASGDAGLAKIVDGLKAVAATGAPTLANLRARFTDLATRIVVAASAPEDDGWFDETLHALSRIVTVRRTGIHLEGDSAEAVTARAEARLQAGNLAGAVTELEALSGAPRAAARAWFEDARRRLEAERILRALERALVATLDEPQGGAGLEY